MDNLQAKQMLKQVDSHGLPRGYNGGYSELYEYCLKSIEKLEQVEQIVKDHDNDSMPEDYFYIDKIREVLNG